MRGRKLREIDYNYNELCDDLDVLPINFKNTKRFSRFFKYIILI